MPYIIVNDSVDPWAYYGGQGILIGVDTVVDQRDAQRFPTLTAALEGPLKRRPELRAAGWRIVPVEK